MSQNPAHKAAAACPLCKAQQKQPCVYRTGDPERIGTAAKACHPERVEAIGDATCSVCGGRLAAHNRICKPLDEEQASWMRSPAFRECVRGVVHEVMRDWPVIDPRLIAPPGQARVLTSILPTEEDLREAFPAFGDDDEPRTLTARELKVAIAPWRDGAEVWVLDGKRMVPVVSTITFGPDSAGHDGLALVLDEHVCLGCGGTECPRDFCKHGKQAGA